MSYVDKYNFWLSNSYFDKETKEELEQIKDNDKEIEERFHKDLDFGTGGIRGIMGAGTNRLNIYTIRKATQGFADYISNHKENSIKNGVAIGYDSRNSSYDFAKEAALVLNGNGIKTYLFDGIRPVALLSFAVRELNCIAGIIITASHNPPEYNGYKVYWSDGCQVTAPIDSEIIDRVNNVIDFTQINRAEENNDLFNIIDKDIDDKYIQVIKQKVVNEDYINSEGKNLKIVYTPIHGSGNKPVRRILEEVGFKNVYVVKEQEDPDGNFPTVKYPNPEETETLELALKYAKETSADLVIGTDPDADRIGIIVRNMMGEYVTLSGNQIGIILTEYILSQKEKRGELPDNGIVISTIVSSNIVKEITKNYGVSYMELLTGFRYIGEKIKEFESSNEYEYIFGFEESYGYLYGKHVRDKDAIISAMLICEVATYYKSKNITIYEGLQEIYKKYGFFKETTYQKTLEGIDGLNKIKSIMLKLRENPPHIIDTVNVTSIRDYKNSIIKNLDLGNTESINLPKSDVLYFELENKSWFCVRPSGTEPKLKIYFGTIGVSENNVTARLQKLIKDVLKLVE